MTSPGSHEARLGMFAAYARRVAQLEQPSWDRLRVRCAELSRPEFSALLRRARHSAKARGISSGELGDRKLGIRALIAVSSVLQMSIATVTELIAEFGTAPPCEPRRPPVATQDSADPSEAIFRNAIRDIETALTQIQPTDPGVATVVRAAGEAVRSRGWLPPGDFDLLYGPIEPEIPFASLTP